MPNEIFLSDAQLAERYAVSRASIWRWHRDQPDFPRTVSLSTGCTRWRLSEIEIWEKTRFEAA
jgi:prophage regulatory protein